MSDKQQSLAELCALLAEAGLEMTQKPDATADEKLAGDAMLRLASGFLGQVLHSDKLCLRGNCPDCGKYSDDLISHMDQAHHRMISYHTWTKRTKGGRTGW